MDAKSPRLSVVIPVYNSHGSLRTLMERLVPALEACGAAHEIILVNDGSADGSWKVVDALSKEHPFVRGINLMRNYGQHNALLCGIRAAEYEVVVTIDDDLQHPPEELEKLLAALTDDVDVVYGTPKREQHGFFRDLASKLTKIALQSAMGAATARKVSAFRVMRTHLRDAFDGYRSPHVNIDILLTWATTSFVAVDVAHDERRVGASNYTFRKLVTHAINMVTGFSTLPLQLASWIGFACTLFGVLVLATVVIRYLLVGSSVPGFSFLASVVALFSGAQLLALGIIGEYVARIHARSLERPAYVVRSDTAEPS
ncbi:MAG: glycosyltransferase family 2 protein [Labilithrix sp.]|nr:glycosyltransferase family 2 protein [Labilithrix sp.]MBX3211210.1 glycosyltransferase family 2 protein [Labilithrix sp.]